MKKLSNIIELVRSDNLELAKTVAFSLGKKERALLLSEIRQSEIIADALDNSKNPEEGYIEAIFTSLVYSQIYAFPYKKHLFLLGLSLTFELIDFEIGCTIMGMPPENKIIYKIEK